MRRKREEPFTTVGPNQPLVRFDRRAQGEVVSARRADTPK